jgi:hydrogenase expression/formation protein HypD
MKAILGSPDCNIHGFLAAGHVCTVMGIEQYSPIARKFDVPIVVTGFEPLDILQGLEMCIRQLEEGRAEVENQYARAVHASGNQVAREVIAEVFQIVPRHWRGVGEIANSGLAMAAPYAEFDAELRFGKSHDVPEMETECISGEVLKGIAKPMDCPNFATRCTPNRPLGAPMVSSEGACAAYFNHRKGMRFEKASTNNTCQYDP